MMNKDKKNLIEDYEGEPITIIDNVREITFCPSLEGADRGWYVFSLSRGDGISVENVRIVPMDEPLVIDGLYGEDGGDIKIHFPYPIKISSPWGS